MMPTVLVPVWRLKTIKSTYKPREVVVDALCCEPLAELELFLHQLVFHLGDLLCCVPLVVACHRRMWGLLKFSIGTHKHLLMHLLWWDDMTCTNSKRQHEADTNIRMSSTRSTRPGEVVFLSYWPSMHRTLRLKKTEAILVFRHDQHSHLMSRSPMR